MSTNEAISRNLAEIQAIQKDNLLYHKSRLVTTSNRVAIVGNVIQNDSNDAINTISSQALESFLVTLEEIKDYLYLFTSKTPSLANRIILYGSDEEQFIKWGERLQHCVEILGKSDKLVGVFDPEQDLRDFQADFSHLKSSLVNIIKLIEPEEENVNQESLRQSLEHLLDHQSDIRSTYQTKNAPTAALEIDPKKIKYEKIIGRGGFGVVWKARYKGEYVAIKTIPLASLTKQSSEALKTEANIMRRLAHPRIVGCYGIFEHEDNQCIVMELMDSGSLHDYIYEKPCPEGWLEREEIAFDICSGMSYLHRLNVIHRDLKPGNVVMDEFLRAKITDFGLSVVKNTAVTSIKGSEQGTIQYMAPECFGFSPVFSTKSDVYAFSIILWELSSWKFAYAGVKLPEIRDGIRSKERLEISPSAPELISEMIKSCWDPNPKSRPDFNSLAKCLEDDIISIQLCYPMAFSLAAIKGKINNSARSYYSSATPDSNNDKGILQAGNSQTVEGKISNSANANYASITPGSNNEKVILKSNNAKILNTEKAAEESNKRFLPNYKALSTKKRVLIFGLCFFTIAALIGVAFAVSYLSSRSEIPNINTTTVLELTPTPSSTPTLSITNGSISYNVSTLSNSFNGVSGIASDSIGNLYVSTQGGNRLFKISSSGALEALAGNNSAGFADGQTSAAKFNNPRGIVYDQAGNIYVADTESSRIRKVTTTGNVSTIAGNGTFGGTDGQGTEATFFRPAAITIDSVGNLYVADTSNHKIRKINTTGYVTTISGNGFAGSVDAQGVKASYAYPQGITIDSAGNLIIADTGNTQIKKLAPSGLVTIIAGNGTVGSADGRGSSATFYTPMGMIFDPDGNLIVSDTKNNIIRKIDSAGYVTTIAGNGSTGLSDGIGTSAIFNYPRGLAFDQSGYLYVADFNNIRKITITKNG